MELSDLLNTVLIALAALPVWWTWIASMMQKLREAREAERDEERRKREARVFQLYVVVSVLLQSCIIAFIFLRDTAITKTDAFTISVGVVGIATTLILFTIDKVASKIVDASDASHLRTLQLCNQMAEVQAEVIGALEFLVANEAADPKDERSALLARVQSLNKELKSLGQGADAQKPIGRKRKPG